MDRKGPADRHSCESKNREQRRSKLPQIVCGKSFSVEIQTGGVAQHFSEFGDIMDDLTNPAELTQISQASSVLVIIEHNVLARTCILSILKREFTKFEIVEMPTTSGLKRLSGRDVRLIALNIEDKQITDPSIEDRLALVAESFPNAYVALLSNRDDEGTASAALQRGVRGFFPTWIPVEVAIAGLRLVLAGGVYRPLPIIRQNEASSLKTISAYTDFLEPSIIHKGNGAMKIVPEKAMVDLTPREQHVLAALKLGLPNKLIAAKLKLSENTIKMHIQHIMRKCAARNRTEAVLRWSGRLSGHNRDTDTSASSAS
jgi:DNA-binding NarL/FixJ family response regulator